MRASRLPSNNQIDNLLSYFQKSLTNLRTVPPPSTQPNKKMQPLHKDTINFFNDLSDILDAFKAEVHSKNGDEIIQRLVWEGRTTDTDEAKAEGKRTIKEQAKNVEIPVEKDKAREDGRTGMSRLTILVFIYSHSSSSSKPHPNPSHPSPHQL